MGISLSILLIAVGAVLAWAVSTEVAGIDLQVAGIIMVISALSASSRRSSSGRAGVDSAQRQRWLSADHRRQGLGRR